MRSRCRRPSTKFLGVAYAALGLGLSVRVRGALPGYTAGQPNDDLDCTVIPILDNRVDYVLHNDDGDLDAVRSSGDLVGEDPLDCTDTDPPLWPSDHLGVVVRMLIDKP
jgi:hypothetical protein